ncbi:uncharacterized protein G2W53_029038 [Senna tora]|uniref:Uncharacterized protein n=1 Tax=Senna tora TaxID=362788 RepID=A0A834TDA8_9FABA|nr:uncharacterized protein G2W53_029038 [Senna tora]
MGSKRKDSGYVWHCLVPALSEQLSKDAAVQILTWYQSILSLHECYSYIRLIEAVIAVDSDVSKSATYLAQSSPSALSSTRPSHSSVVASGKGGDKSLIFRGKTMKDCLYLGKQFSLSGLRLGGKVCINSAPNFITMTALNHVGYHAFGHGHKHPRHQDLVLTLLAEILRIGAIEKFIFSNEELSRDMLTSKKKVVEVISINYGHHLKAPYEIVEIIQFGGEWWWEILQGELWCLGRA